MTPSSFPLNNVLLSSLNASARHAIGAASAAVRLALSLLLGILPFSFSSLDFPPPLIEGEAAGVVAAAAFEAEAFANMFLSTSHVMTLIPVSVSNSATSPSEYPAASPAHPFASIISTLSADSFRSTFFRCPKIDRRRICTESPALLRSFTTAENDLMCPSRPFFCSSSRCFAVSFPTSFRFACIAVIFCPIRYTLTADSGILGSTLPPTGCAVDSATAQSESSLEKERADG